MYKDLRRFLTRTGFNKKVNFEEIKVNFEQMMI